VYTISQVVFVHATAEADVIMNFAYEYTYQDCEYITRKVDILPELWILSKNLLVNNRFTYGFS